MSLGVACSVRGLAWREGRPWKETLQEGVAGVGHIGLFCYTGARGRGPGSNHRIQPRLPWGPACASHSRGSGQWGSLESRLWDKVSVKGIC